MSWQPRASARETSPTTAASASSLPAIPVAIRNDLYYSLFKPLEKRKGITLCNHARRFGCMYEWPLPVLGSLLRARVEGDDKKVDVTYGVPCLRVVTG